MSDFFFVVHLDYFSVRLPPAGIHEHVMTYLDHRSLGCVSQLSRRQNILVSESHYSHFSRVLAPFDVDPNLLLSVLHRRKAIISGSVALAMILPGIVFPRTIDIYAPNNQPVQLIVDILRLFPSYKYVDQAEIGKRNPFNGELHHFNAWLPGICSVHTLSDNVSDTHINVTVVSGSDPLPVIFSFDATHAMNFVSSTGFGCMYPQLTLRMQSLRSGGPRSRQAWMDEQIKLGFSIAPLLDELIHPSSHQCTVHPSCPRTYRHLRDAHMLFGSFKLGDDGSPQHALENYVGNLSWTLPSRCLVVRGSLRLENRNRGYDLGHVDSHGCFARLGYHIIDCSMMMED